MQAVDISQQSVGDSRGILATIHQEAITHQCDCSFTPGLGWGPLAGTRHRRGLCVGMEASTGISRTEDGFSYFGEHPPWGICKPIGTKAWPKHGNVKILHMLLKHKHAWTAY
jgi:hypothetical protein